MGAIISNKTELLAEKERAYDEFVATIANLDDAQFALEPKDEDWTPKDAVAHVAYWESSLAKALLAFLLEETPLPGFVSYDKINAFSTTLRRTSSLTEVLGELETAYSDVTAIVEEFVTDATLERTVAVAYASRVEHKPISEVLTSYIKHFSEHAAQVRSWRAARGV